MCVCARYTLQVIRKAFTLHTVNTKINFTGLDNIATGVIILLTLTNNGEVDKIKSNLSAVYIQDKEHEKSLI